VALAADINAVPRRMKIRDWITDPLPVDPPPLQGPKRVKPELRKLPRRPGKHRTIENGPPQN